ncbi:uncharacterized protein [Rhodnius prolixus]
MNYQKATGYNYPESFYNYIREIERDEELEKEIFPDGHVSELRSPSIMEEDCLDNYNVLWNILRKEQRKRDCYIMKAVWDSEKDEKLFKKCKVLTELDKELLPTFAKVCLVCLYAVHSLKKNKRFKYFIPNLMLAEALWNFNPHHPKRREMWRTLEEIPILRELLPPYPKYSTSESKLCDNEAATIIQAAYRGYRVRSKPEVLELRAFWEALKLVNRVKQAAADKTVGKTPKWHDTGAFFTERQIAAREFARELRTRTGSF